MEKLEWQESLEKKYANKIVVELNKGSLVTFVPNKSLPIYNWFYYKEGFSRDFVMWMFDEFSVSKDEVVLDPFLGSGTTLLAAKEMGIKGIGFELNPPAYHASKVKLRDYDKEKLGKAYKDIMEEWKRIKVEEEEIKKYPKIIKKGYPLRNLLEIERLKVALSRLDDNKIRDFFILVAMKASSFSTLIEKDGGSLKINKKRKVMRFRDSFKITFKKMLLDLDRITFIGREEDYSIMQEDARRISRGVENKVDVVITSPPYLNKIEYTNVYAPENILFLNNKQDKPPLLRSFIGEGVKRIDKDMEDEIISRLGRMNNISIAYFVDMLAFIRELKKVMRRDARGAIVIGDGCFPDHVIRASLALSKIMEEEGFNIERIIRVNRRWCMRSRVIKVGSMYEDIVIFKA